MAGHRNQLQIILVGQLLIRFANRIETVKKRHPVPFLNDIADRLDQSERTFVAIHKSLSIHKEDRDMSEVKQPASALSSPRFCNMGTFMRMQKVDSAGGLDFAIAGAPFDTGSSFRSGSRFGPNAIRNISAMMKPNNVIMQVNIMESLKGGDIGDFNITPAMMRLKKSSPVFWKKNACPIVPGGDHAITRWELWFIRFIYCHNCSKLLLQRFLFIHHLIFHRRFSSALFSLMCELM